MAKLKPIAIIGAMEPEVALLRETMTNGNATRMAGFSMYHGDLEHVPVILMQCGIGKVNAAVGTTLLLDHFNARAVINTGSAGALDDALNIGDVIVADAVLHHDVDVTAFGYEPGQMAQMPARYACDPSLAKAASQAAAGFQEASIHHGLVVSGDQFIHSQEARKKIKQTFPEAAAVEMEAAAIAQVCYRFGVPFVMIRAISDNANGEAESAFDQFLTKAATHSAQTVCKLLADL